MTRRLAERVVAWRWYIIAAWVVLGIALVTLAPSLTGFTSSGYGLPGVVPVDAGPGDRRGRLPVRGVGLRHH